LIDTNPCVLPNIRMIWTARDVCVTVVDANPVDVKSFDTVAVLVMKY